MKYKLKDYKKDGDRIILTIESSELFGLIRNYFDVIDSNKIYSYNGQSVWYILPNKKRIDGGTHLLEFCNQCKTQISLDEKKKSFKQS